jgi:hypothetical protein
MSKWADKTTAPQTNSEAPATGLSAEDQRHLAALQAKLALVRDRTRSVAMGYTTGAPPDQALLLCGFATRATEPATYRLTDDVKLSGGRRSRVAFQNRRAGKAIARPAVRPEVTSVHGVGVRPSWDKARGR